MIPLPHFTTVVAVMALLPREGSYPYDGCAFTPPANEPHLVDTFYNLELPPFFLGAILI